MKINIEGREFKLSANGSFLKKFCDIFEENLTVVLYNAMQKRDPLSIAKLMYACIDDEGTFEEWLNTFESPFFIVPHMDKILEFLARDTTPKVQAKGGEEDSKKKTLG